jgi:hypothetical protein
MWFVVISLRRGWDSGEDEEILRGGAAARLCPGLYEVC